MTAAVIMIQGTGSDVGKSMVVAGLCRLFAQRGLKVRPFKPQNMSNNAAATADGGEIGRAQALQARACGVAPTVDMNPVLLKPQSEIGAQVVVRGKVVGNARAREFQAMKPALLDTVLESFGRLRAEADLVIVEGAGSAAEVNLRANDIANMGFARAAAVPVILLGDIDRGGVLAQIVGTKAVIDPADAALVRGFLVNKFRGDPALFDDGLRLIERHTGWPSLGLIPFFAEAGDLPAEDAVALSHRPRVAPEPGGVRIVVPVLPHISNFDDLDPLRREPGVTLTMARDRAPLPPADLIILPGSKATIADLAELRRRGWDIDILAHVRQGRRVLGLCGGFQMLGQTIADPEGLEGPVDMVRGLGLLDVTTVLSGPKTVRPVGGVSIADGVPFEGYEMHVGSTFGPDCDRPLLRLADGTSDGAATRDGHVAGCYVHGLFGHDAQRGALLRAIGAPVSELAFEAGIERTLDRLAAHLERHVRSDRLLELAKAG